MISPFGNRLLARMALLLALFVASTATASAAEPLFAARSVLRRYWDGFAEYWGGSFKSQSSITMIVIGTGLIALFIITRGKWQK